MTKKLWVLITFLVISSTINACKPANTQDQDLPPTFTATLQATSTPQPTQTATPSPTPTPTINPFLANSNLQSDTSTIFGNGIIKEVFFSKEENNVLIQTEFGIYIYDINTWERLAFLNTPNTVIVFNGKSGYMLSPDQWDSGADRNSPLAQIVNFEVNQNTIQITNPVSLKDENLQDIELRYVEIADDFNTIIGVKAYPRNENGVIQLTQSQDYYIWDNIKSAPLVSFTTSSSNTNVQEAGVSANNAFIAIAMSNKSIYLSNLIDENASNPTKIYNHPDRIIDLDISPDSKLVLSSDCSGNITLYHVDTQLKENIKLDAEDYFTAGSVCLISKTKFLDENTIGISTNTGKLIFKDIENNETSKYQPTPNKITHFFHLNNDSILLFTQGKGYQFNIPTNETTEVISDFEISGQHFLNNNELAVISRSQSGTAQISVWDLETYTKSTLEYPDIGYPEKSFIYVNNLNNNSILVGGIFSHNHPNILLAIDMDSWELIDINNENNRVNPRHKIHYSDATNQFIAAGGTDYYSYEIVFSEEDDPLFRNDVSKLRTTRSIVDFTLSKDGTKIYVLEKGGLFEIFNVEEQKIEKTLSTRASGELYPINDEVILIQDDNDLFTLNIESREFKEISPALPDFGCSWSPTINSSKDPAEPWVTISCNYGIIVYDVINDSVITDYPLSNFDIPKIQWEYEYDPVEEIILGWASDGVYKIIEMEK